MSRPCMILTTICIMLIFLSGINVKGEDIEMEKSKVIDGVGRLGWGKGMESTFMGALTVTIHAMGEDVSYDYLMGISGASFRLMFQWCPSSPDARCGYDHSIPLLKALGYEIEEICADQNKPEEVAKVREAVVKSIDKGFPVVAIDLIQSPDWGVIVGYDKNGDEFISRTYYDKSDEYTKAEKWPWIVMIIKNKIDPPAKDESIIKSLQIAVDTANTKAFGDYASGFSAYETWASDLLDDDKFEKASEDDLKSKLHVNGWVYDSLINARSSAVKYLKSISGEFDGESADHLAKATGIYDEITKKMLDNWKHFPMAWQLENPSLWTKEMRHTEAGILNELLAMEKNAIKELEMVIKTENKENKTQINEKKVVIEGVDHYKVIEPLFECVRVALSNKGETYSPEYVCGISGAAFRIAGICPCAPTCSSAMWTPDLVGLFGYQFEVLPLDKEGMDLNAEVQKVIPRVKDQIRKGRPVIVWHAFTNAEWDVVCGFDEETKQFIGRGSYAGTEEYATADETRMTKAIDICPAFGAIIVGDKVGEFNAMEAELAALREALKHAWTEKVIEEGKWTMLEGVQCYERWIDEFENAPNRKRGSGDSYCYGVYHSTHRAASVFLKEIAPKYPEAKENLENASEYFKAEADILDQCKDLIWWNAPEGPDAERNAKFAELLAKARDNYVSGIDEIELALEAIEGE